MSDVDFFINWYCPSCKVTGQTLNSTSTEIPLHRCSKFNGLEVSMVREGVRAVNKERLREDYLNGDLSSSRNSSNEVVQSVETEYEDGSVGGTIYLPCAVFSIDRK